MPSPEVELRNRVLQSSTEGSQPTPRAGPRCTVPIRPTASSQYVGLSTANYFRHITTTTTTTTTQTLKATSTVSRQAATSCSRQQQQTYISSSSGQPQNAVRSSEATPVQTTNSSSHRRVSHGGPEGTRQTPSAKDSTSRLHFHTTNEATTAPVEDHHHTVVDLMEYALRHKLMDSKLLKVLYDRAAKELVRRDQIERFNALIDQYYDSRPSMNGDNKPVYNESRVIRTKQSANHIGLHNNHNKQVKL
ncbi:hypothetical protein BGX34_008220 [Mortierella sp. NVP85]|nr:hypothetical protein BGX34_008220 [Mortierella sp. NVP85]